MNPSSSPVPAPAAISKLTWWLSGVFLLVLLFTASSSQADSTLVPRGATWKYLDNGTNQGTAWKETNFSETTWKSGPAELGYGDGTEGRPEATVVGYGPDPNNRYITTYFRHTFSVADASVFGSLKLRVIRDDGVVVYLNGKEVWRDKLPTGTIGYQTLATAALGGADEYTFVDIVIPTTHLVTGQNVLAVEIHQANATSTDISFDLELIGRPPGLVRQPYLQIGTPTSMVIRWRTDVATDTVLRYGPTPTSLTSEVKKDTTTPVTEHEVTLTGLTPDTRYYYSVGSSATTYAGGEDYVFFTAPPIGAPHPTRIWVIGDAGTGTANQLAVRDSYYNFAQGGYTDVMLMLGDNVYETGTDNEYTTRHFDVYRDILKRTVTWPTIGNHDTAGSSAPSSTIPYYQSFSLPKEGQAGGVPSGTEDYYSFDYGEIHFICLDSMTESRQPTSPMVNWLRQDLANTTQKWIIAYWHHPPYSKGHDSDTDTFETEMRKNVVPVLEEYGVDLVLFGHSHAYERSYLLNGHYGTSSTLNISTMIKDGTDGRGVGGYNKPTLEGAGREGAVYAVAGSSGKTQDYAGISDTGTGNGTGHPAMYISWERLGSLVIDVDGHKMDVKFLRENGTVADNFSITRGPRTNTPPSVSITSPVTDTEFKQGAPVAINATASDADQIQEVVFYANSSRIGRLAGTPGNNSYSLQWTPPERGNYRLEVRAADSLGNTTVSDPVDIKVAVGLPSPDTTAPAAVSNLDSSSISTNSVTLIWSAPGDDGLNGTAASYDLRYSTTDPNSDTSADKAVWWANAAQLTDEPVPASAGSTQSYVVGGLNAATTFYFALRTTDEANNVSLISNTPAVTTLVAPPEAPTTLTATVGPAGQVQLRWTDNSSDETEFSIERSLDGTSGFTQLQIVGANVTTYTDTLVYAGTTYFYRVIASKSGASSTPTNVARVTTPPAAPTNLQAVPAHTQITLTWNGSTGAQSYSVRRYNNATASFEIIASGLASTTTSYTNTGLTSDTDYTYQINAANSGGESPFAEVTTRTTVPQPPQAPAGLSASAASATQINLTWTDNSTNEAGFHLERSIDGTNFSQIATAGVNATSYSDSTVSGGTTYHYRIRAYNGDGTSGYSNAASATTPAPVVVPAAPTGLSVRAVSRTQIDLTWADRSTNETGFRIERSTDNRTYTQIATVGSNVTSYSNTGLQANKLYYFRVRAYNSAGNSAYSNTASVKTLK